MSYYTKGAHVGLFCKTYCVQTKGRWAGRPLEFEGWQQELVDEMYLVDENGRRVYQIVLIGIPRKNGKSSIAAGIGLYELAAAGENEPEVILAAASREQAGIVFRQANGYVTESPALSDILIPRRSVIECPENRGTLKSVSADGKLQHGLNPSAIIGDELHAWLAPKTEELWEALTTGSIAREEPLTICITTAGYEKDSILGRMYDNALTLPGVEHRPGLTIARDRENGFLMWWYHAEDGCDVEDTAQWRLANPASWIEIERLRRQLRSPAMTENKFRRLHLNQWTSVEEIWIPPKAWSACANPDMRFQQGEAVWVGVDMAAKNDRAAVVWVAKSGNRFKVNARIFEDDRPTEMVIRVENFIRSLRKSVRIMELRYDPHLFGRSAITLSGEGIQCVEFPQSDSMMVPASQFGYQVVTEQRLEHPNHPVLTRHVLAAVAVETERGFRVKKARSKGKIDGAVALILALSGAQAGAGEFFMY